MKRIASVIAALALAVAPVAGLASTSSATNVATFSAVGQRPHAFLPQTMLVYKGSWGCYDNLRHQARKLDGKLVVWLEGTRTDRMCIQSVETMNVIVPAIPGTQIVDLKDAGLPLIEA